MPRRLLATIVGLFAAAVALLVVAQSLGTNSVYFRTPSEAVALGDANTARMRLAGAVVPDSVDHVADGVTFRLTDGVTVVDVHHHGEPPELFADGAPIVCEGTWEGSSFRSDRLMIKHGSEYEPPDVLDTSTETVAADEASP